MRIRALLISSRLESAKFKTLEITGKRSRPLWGVGRFCLSMRYGFAEPQSVDNKNDSRLSYRDKMKHFIIAASVAALLLACSDDSPSSSENASVSSIYELGACNNDNKGESKFVEDKNDYYVCVSGEWVGVNEKSSSSSRNASVNSSSFETMSSSSSSAQLSSSSSRNASVNSSSFETMSSSSSSAQLSSSSVASIYTTSLSTLTITLTSFKQLKSMDEKNDTDGDPRISFIVMTNKDGVSQIDSTTTEEIDLDENVGYWTGREYFSAVLSKGIDIVEICPVFVDIDVLFNDKEYTSNECYLITDVGRKIGKAITQTDDGSAYYTMDWEVRIDY